MTYNELFKAVMERAYEVEGLLLLTKRNDVDRDAIFNIIRAKVDDMANILADADTSACGHDDKGCDTATDSPVIDEETPLPEEPTNNMHSSETETPEWNASENFSNESESEIEENDESEQNKDKNPIVDDLYEYEQEKFDIDNDDDNRTLHDSDEECGSIMTFDYVEPTKTMAADADSVNDSETKEEMPQASADSFDKTPSHDIPYTGNDEEDITVDKLLQRSISRNLKHAFSINDRFRYRRELFENSDVEMNDALNLVEAMQTFAEAEEYFYDILKWDKDSDEVIEFMTIIKNHFYSK